VYCRIPIRTGGELAVVTVVVRSALTGVV